MSLFVYRCVCVLDCLAVRLFVWVCLCVFVCVCVCVCVFVWLFIDVYVLGCLCVCVLSCHRGLFMCSCVVVLLYLIDC